ncbi:TIGR02452 family protein [Pedosphaera parvula]|uniref:Microbial-type PARG catalytic domain-containing protein n=1 Tax=Pedosphaera parvula (strain Ellin514) TaxID=320771 RepID=B9XNB3_PEDPL|nr:TIGR02452 family protein [Pedosphaera parvula]EEF58666.1 conserved hypothetical protein [Pedosphaera parvula Ellin514]
MSRTIRSTIAQQTVSILEAGHYTAPSGRKVELADAIKHALAGTTLHENEVSATVSISPALAQTKIEVTPETTFEASARLAAQPDGPIACLNFASAKNPGGGFLTGAQAQEECLARSSALYHCLLSQPAYYERNRANRSTLYLDLLIYSPDVPFFRDDAGQLLEKPVFASVITAPAPNRGALADNEPQSLPLVEPTLARRAAMVLSVAAGKRVKRLILGAWGCGVFRNDPRMVAQCFAAYLDKGGKFAGCFDEVVFAIYDKSENRATYSAFAEVFANR